MRELIICVILKVKHDLIGLLYAKNNYLFKDNLKINNCTVLIIVLFYRAAKDNSQWKGSEEYNYDSLLDDHILRG